MASEVRSWCKAFILNDVRQAFQHRQFILSSNCRGWPGKPTLCSPHHTQTATHSNSMVATVHVYYHLMEELEEDNLICLWLTKEKSYFVNLFWEYHHGFQWMVHYRASMLLSWGELPPGHQSHRDLPKMFLHSLLHAQKTVQSISTSYFTITI